MIDRDTRSVTVAGRDCTMTGNQFDLLWALAANAGRVMSRDALMDAVRGEALEAFDRSIDVHISRIRAAIEDVPRNTPAHHHRARRRLHAGEDSGLRKARLYLRIYLSFIGILAVFAVLVSIVWHLHGRGHENPRYFRGAGMLTVRLLPPPGSDQAKLPHALQELASHFDAEVALFDADRTLIAATAYGLPAPPASAKRGRFLHRRGHRGALLLALPDGRWLVARHAPRWQSGWRPSWLPLVALLALSLAIGAYPLARRITRRLERLKNQVEALGSGHLGARVEVEGRDEVADLAESFNRAAERIENLVEGERTMLASASHELRTPLARIRMAS